MEENGSQLAGMWEAKSRISQTAMDSASSSTVDVRYLCGHSGCNAFADGDFEETDHLSSVVQTNSATAEESSAASQELSVQAKTLKGLVEEFKLKNNK